MLSPSTKLPSVPEEYHPSDDLYRSLNVNYDDVAQSAFYQQTTNAAINSSPSMTVSNNDDQKFYLKSEPDQPLPLSVSQDVSSKGGYRNNMYHDSSVNSVYNQNNTNYIPYSSQNYHQPAQPHHQDGVVVNYSHQSNVKLVFNDMKSVYVKGRTNVAFFLRRNASSSLPINYNNSLMSNHHYSSYESTSSYNTSTANVQSSYTPSTSSNYKILSTSRSSRSTSLNADEEMFAVPKV